MFLLFIPLTFCFWNFIPLKYKKKEKLTGLSLAIGKALSTGRIFFVVFVLKNNIFQQNFSYILEENLTF